MTDGGAVGADGAASLLPGLDLFVHSLLLGNDGSQGVGHSLKLLLVYIMKVVHVLCERSMHHVVAAGVPSGCFMYRSDDFTQEGELFIL